MTFTDYINTIYLQDPKVTRDIALEDWIINQVEQDATILDEWVKEWKKLQDKKNG